MPETNWETKMQEEVFYDGEDPADDAYFMAGGISSAGLSRCE